jgi:pimeloyl-ACP methyl ester carboxylesterase
MEIDELPHVQGVSHRFVDVGGVSLHVAEAGAGEPLVLLHGWPQHWWCWRLLIPPLARSYRVIAPDLRGFGWSDAPAGDYAKATFAADVRALLDVEGLDRVRVIGHDWGGWAAMLLALESPERISRLLALDISPPWPQRPRPRQLALPLLASYQALLASPLGPPLLMRSPSAVQMLIRGASAHPRAWSVRELAIYSDVLREPARASASSACYRTFLTRELPAMLRGGDRSGELTVPTLVAMGERSAIRRVLDPRPSGQLRVETVVDAGHFLPEEAPTAVLRLAERWFDRAT